MDRMGRNSPVIKWVRPLSAVALVNQADVRRSLARVLRYAGSANNRTGRRFLVQDSSTRLL